MTGNPIRGEVLFTAAGVQHRLVLDMNALCTLEERLDLSVNEIVEKLRGKVRAGFIREVLWAGLRSGEPELTLDEVGDLMTELSFNGAIALVIEGLTKAFPKVEDANATADPPEPKRRRGTSPPSSPAGAS